MDDEDEVKRYDKMVTRMHEEDDKTIYDIADDLKADRDMLASNLSSCVEVLEKTKVIVDRLRGELTRLTADRMDLDNARALFENCRRLQEENERLRGLLCEVIDGTACDEYSVTWEWLERAKAEVGERPDI